MPIPKPGPTEDHDTFMSRCMGDDDMQEYDQKQRYAVCQSAWDKDKKMASDDRETRSLPVAELRVEGDGAQRTITGYAAVFNKPSLDLGGFVERIAPGAFAEVLASTPDIRALINHDPSLVLGRTTAGTLDLAENTKGLAITIRPPDTQIARDVSISIARGDINEMSFAFAVGKDTWTLSMDPAAPDERLIEEVRMVRDISVVTFPAYPDTSVAVRSLEAARAGQGKPKGTPRKDACRIALVRRRAGWRRMELETSLTIPFRLPVLRRPGK